MFEYLILEFLLTPACLLHFIWLCVVHTYGALLEPDLTYISLRPEQLSADCMEVSLDEETSSMDEIPQMSPSKPPRKNKGTTVMYNFQ